MRHPVCVSNSSAPGFNGLLESFKRRCLLSLLLPLPLFWKYIIPLTLYSRNGKSVQIALWSLSFYFNFGISTSFKEVGQTPLAWSQATSHTVNGRWWWCFLLTLLYSSWSPPLPCCHCSACACQMCQRHSTGLQWDPCATNFPGPAPPPLLNSPWGSSCSSSFYISLSTPPPPRPPPPHSLPLSPRGLHRPPTGPQETSADGPVYVPPASNSFLRLELKGKLWGPG